MNILILGAGLVGRPMALDLSKDDSFKLSVSDISENRLHLFNGERFSIIQGDLSDMAFLKKIIIPFDLVLNALPGHLGYQASKTVIEGGKNLVDISFFPEDPFSLEEIAEKMKIKAVIDCGVAPGMSYALVGYVSGILDMTTKVRIYVGGLPVKRELPWEYKAVFSPADVIEEYMRPARIMENGKIVAKEALSDLETMSFKCCGPLEAFNTDGLRSLLKTIPCPDMVEKTLRYPGYSQKIMLLKNSGFFNTETLDIKGQKIVPLDMTCSLLFPQWQLKEGDEDITVMKIVVEGIKRGHKIRYTYNLVDHYDRNDKIHSMARTTGYTATSVIKMISENILKENGLILPEYLGKSKTYIDFMLDYLSKRRVNYSENVEKIL